MNTTLCPSMPPPTPFFDAVFETLWTYLLGPLFIAFIVLCLAAVPIIMVWICMICARERSPVDQSDRLLARWLVRPAEEMTEAQVEELGKALEVLRRQRAVGRGKRDVDVEMGVGNVEGVSNTLDRGVAVSVGGMVVEDVQRSTSSTQDTDMAESDHDFVEFDESEPLCQK